MSILIRGLILLLLSASIANAQEQIEEKVEELPCLIIRTTDGRNFELAQHLYKNPQLTFTLRLYDMHFPMSGDKASCLEERVQAKRMFDIIQSILENCGTNYCPTHCRFDKWVPNQGGTVYGEIYINKKRLTQILIEREAGKPINETPVWCPTKIIDTTQPSSTTTTKQYKLVKTQDGKTN